MHVKSNPLKFSLISDKLTARLPQKNCQLFSSSIKAFRHAVDKAEINLPKGQMSHVLRHTFASHFMMNGGNILVLQRILGHASIVDTMKYSHFAPDHLEDAVRLNPLAD